MIFPTYAIGGLYKDTHTLESNVGNGELTPRVDAHAAIAAVWSDAGLVVVAVTAIPDHVHFVFV